jgi:hypothetical protein
MPLEAPVMTTAQVDRSRATAGTYPVAPPR